MIDEQNKAGLMRYLGGCVELHAKLERATLGEAINRLHDSGRCRLGQQRKKHSHPRSPRTRHKRVSR